MSSMTIALNALRRLAGRNTLVVFLLVFPVIAAALGMILGTAPETLDLGITDDPAADGVHQAFAPLEEYRVHRLSEEELITGIRNGDLAAGIAVSGDSSHLYDVISLNGGNAVNSLRNQLLYWVEEGSVYSLTADSGTSGMAIGMYLLFMIMFIGNCALILLDDRRERTMMRLFCMPVKTHQVIGGYLLALMLAGLLQIFWFIFILTAVLRVDTGLSAPQLFVLLSAFLASASGLAVGLAGIIRSKDRFNVALPVIALFSTFLSGSLIPLDAFGEGASYLAYFIPQHWVISAAEQLRAGAPLTDTGLHLGVLLLFAMVFFSFGSRLLNRETL